MSKKISFKKVAILTIFFTFCMFLSTIYADDIDYDDATKIAEQKSIELSDNTCGNLVNIKPLYNLQGTVYGYYYQYQYFYIVIGVNKSDVPIIEYGENQFFINNVIETQDLSPDNVEYLYLGNLCYGYSYNNEYYKITEGSVEKITDTVYYAETEMKNTSEIEEQWQILDCIIDENSDGNSTYVSGEIKNPLDYEKYYYSSSSKNVPSYNYVYEVMSTFTGYTDHCSPTAAVNLLKYWYLRDNTKYNCLLKTSWTNTFKLLYSYMGTNTNAAGTVRSNIKTGYQKFFSTCSGLGSVTVEYIDSPSFTEMENEIQAGYPFHLSVTNNNYYGNHSLVALGYRAFTYKNGTTYTGVHYFLVADGWNTSARYVNCSINNGGVAMTRVRLPK